MLTKQSNTVRVSLAIGAFVIVAAIGIGAKGLIDARTLSPQPSNTPQVAVQNAWQMAHAAGSYQFDGDVTQVTLPTARITNVGRSSKSTQMHIEGKTDVRQNSLELQLWTNSGSVGTPNNADSIGVKVEEGKAYLRQGATGEWKENKDFSLDGLAPNGDFMAFLHAMRDVQAHPPETKAGISFTRYSFQIDGPVFATFMRDQMEAAMRAKGELVPGTHLDIPERYTKMTGDGEMWLHTGGPSDGLPLRQIINLNFPDQNDSSMHAQIKVNFLEFGKPPTSGLMRALQRAGDILPSPITFALVTFTLTAFGVLLRFYALRRFQSAATIILITVIVSGPLFNGLQTGAIVDAKVARAAASATNQQAETQAAVNSRALRAMDASAIYSPQQNPLQAAELRARAETRLANTVQAVGLSSMAAAPLQQTLPTDSATDTDNDGLSDFVEERVGTDRTFSDSDEDGLSDNLEVKGFTVGGKTWYLNPLDIDSNKDGIADLQEFDNDGNNIADDTDADGLPDVFDPDNDNDGVPDDKDIAPFTKSTTIFTDTNPLQLTLNGLQAGKTTFVDFQIRPQTPSHLWFAFNVLDWPQDADGQVRDIDGKTFADLGGSGAADANGDMRLIPMLEIRVPNFGAHLPPQAALTPYNISVNNLTTNGSSKVAYVPLSVVTDEKTGERVAFNARMRYLPNGAWTNPHEVRMVWNVIALVDVACDPKAPNAAARGCASDGYIRNVPQVLHSYADNFSLTGMNVTEDNGSGMAIIYEDPEVDTDRKDDRTLVALSHGLDNAFLSPRDQDNNGVRDINLNEIKRRFERTTNAAVSATERWGTDNVLRVELTEYDLADKASAFTAMTETKRILNSVFAPYWLGDKALKPMLMFAQEQRYRGLGMDGSREATGFVNLSGSNVTFNMAPAGQPASPVLTSASLKWTPYCAPDGSSPAWAPCKSDAYWTELETRYGNAAALPTDPANETNVAEGRMFAARMYILALMQGVSRVVQSGTTRIVKINYSLKSDSEVESLVRTAANLGKLVATVIAGEIVTAKFVNKVTVLQHFGRLFKELRAGRVGQLAGDAIDILRAFRSGGHLNRLVGTAIVVGAGLILSGLITGVAYLVDAKFSDDPQKNYAAKVTINVIIAAAITYFSFISPIKDLVEWRSTVKAAGESLKLGSSIKNSSLKASAIGTVIAVAVTWGFFIYSVVQNKVSAFSPEFNKAFAEAIATTIFLVTSFVISSTVIGTILVAIVAVIDAILTAICESGVDALRTVPGLGGACFTLSTSAIKVLAYFLYNYESMIDTSRSDMVVTGQIDVKLGDPSKGYIAGNSLTINMPITTNIRHKDPNPEQGLLINGYLYLFSQDNLKSSSYKYALSQANTPLTLSDFSNRMPGAWTVSERETKYAATTMYKAYASTNPIGPLGGVPLNAGINQAAAFNLNMGYAIPAYECWLMPFPFLPFVPPIPVCYSRELSGSTSTKFDNLSYDVYPATLDSFMTLSNKGANGLGLGWDAAFDALKDADGDGLISVAKSGIDPNDSTWDSDGDGLSDAFELERRQAGTNYSPISCDTDQDGLTDKQETDISSDPSKVDSDNDGLKDGEEVWHQVYTVATVNGVTTCTPTANYTGGWDVTVNATTPFVVHVSSNPLLADGDSDGVSDLAEKQLALSPTASQRVDAENRPYHPNLLNVPPVQVNTTVDDADGMVGLGQAVRYTTTVIANTPLGVSVLDVSAPPALGALPAPYNLPFGATTPQTVTQSTLFTVQANASTQVASITSTVRSRLPNIGTPGLKFDPIVSEAQLGSFIAPFAARQVSLAAARTDRQDNFLLPTLTRDSTTAGSNGDIVNFQIPSGASTAIENDGNNVFAKRGSSTPVVATNNSGDSLVVWEQQERCNVITFNAMQVVAAAADANGGIEPIITLKSDVATPGLAPLGGVPTNESIIWTFTSGGGTADMKPGDLRSRPNFGFPITQQVCGNYSIHVWEIDGGNTAEDVGLQTYDSMTAFGNRVLRFAGSGHDIAVDITVEPKDVFVLKGALVNVIGGSVPVNFTRPPVASPLYKTKSFGPTVATDGSGFVVVYEAVPVSKGPTQQWVGESDGIPYVAAQAFDKNGTAIGNSATVFGTTTNTTGQNSIALDVAWFGTGYRTAVKPAGSGSIQFRDFTTTAVGGAAGFLAGPTNAVTRINSNIEQMAFDPFSGRWLLAYLNSSGLPQFNLYPNVGSTTPSVQRTVGSEVSVGVSAVFNPVVPGWMGAGVFDGVNGQHRYYPLKSNDLTDLTPLQSWTGLAGNGLTASDLACPLPSSQPIVDLRFEELPGATTFADSSGRSNNASAIGTAPSAGWAGATTGGVAVGTPASDFATGYASGNAIGVNTSVANNFSVAFWIKAKPNLNNNAIVIDQGANQANGWTIWLGNGQISFLVGANGLFQSPARIDNDAWQFVTITRNGDTGRSVIYVNGVAVNTNTTFGTAALTAVNNIRIGNDRNNARGFSGLLDNLQIYPTVLAADMVKALYDRTQQNYCVAARPTTSGNGVAWAKLRLTQPDVRGGKITASSGLTLTIDGDKPVSTLTSLKNGQYVEASVNRPTNRILIIGGNAVDATSRVATVEVSVNNGPWQLAEGTESWSFPLELKTLAPNQTFVYNIRTRATDALGNVETPTAGITINADATAPQVAWNGLPGPAVPTRAYRRADGQWIVTLTGPVGDTFSNWPSSGVKTGSVTVQLFTDRGNTPVTPPQTASFANGTWVIEYVFPSSASDAPPVGSYFVGVAAEDNVGLRTSAIQNPVLNIDTFGPTTELTATNTGTGILTNSITSTMSIGGLITDTGLGGLDGLDIAFAPITQVVPVTSSVLQLGFEEDASWVWYQDSSGQFSSAYCPFAVPSCPISGGAGRIGRALQFGTGAVGGPVNALKVIPGQKLNFANQSFTVQGWVKLGNTVPYQLDLFSNLANNGKNGYVLQVAANTGRASLLLKSNSLTGGQLAVTGGPDLRNNQWHFLTGVYDHIKTTASVYVDGVQVASAPVSAANFAGTIAVVTIGDSSVRREGMIDDIAVFASAFGASNILAQYRMADTVWYPATLAQSGSTVTRTTWSLATPSGLDGLYQIDMRGKDFVGNRQSSLGAWRGIVDTRAPIVKISGIATGQSYTDTANVRRYEVLYTCTANDFLLDESKFNCPGSSTQEPVRGFNNDPSIKAIFPDLALLTTLSITKQVWEPTLTPSQTLSACDAYAHCATTTTSLTLNPVAALATAAQVSDASNVSEMSDAEGNTKSTQSVEAISADSKGVIIKPARGEVVRGSNGSMLVSVAAESDKAIKDITVLLDGAAAGTLSFSQAKNKTRVVQSLTITGTEGTHTMSVQVSDWAGGTSAPSTPIRFTLLSSAPQISVGTTKFTISDTYQIGSGVVRLHGTVDTSNLAAVQVRVGDGPFAEANFGDSQWSIALAVKDQDNRQLPITVVAIDRTGQHTTVSNSIAQDISTANPPQTNISSGPSGQSRNDAPAYDPEAFTKNLASAERTVTTDDIDTSSNIESITGGGATSGNPNNATFVFEGTRGEREIVGFVCSLDGGDYASCTSPVTYSDLSKGTHNFKVRAMDASGFVDPTPASFDWVVTASQPDVILKTGPSNPSLLRSASFGFMGDNSAKTFECSLDGRGYTVCSSGQRYSGLGNGNHTFLVRAIDATGKRGNAARYTWRTVNAAPVAQSQVFTTSDETPLAIQLAASDEDTVTFRVLTHPSHGSLHGTPPNLTYIPESDFFGFDEFSVVANDGQIDSASATVRITVQRGVRRFAALSLYGVSLGQQAVITSGDIGAVGRTNEDMDDKDGGGKDGHDFALEIQNTNGSNGDRDFVEVYVAQQARMLNANNFALGDTVVIRQAASLFNVGYNQWLNQGTVLGDQRKSLDLRLLPSLPSVPTVTPSSKDVLVGVKGNLVLDPGSYANVWVKTQGTLTLKPGVYHFKSVLVEAQGKVLMQGATDLRVMGRLLLSSQATLGPAPEAKTLNAKQIRIYVAAVNPTRQSVVPNTALEAVANNAATQTNNMEAEGSNIGENLVPNQADDEGGISAVALGQNSQISANIIAPNGAIWVGQHSDVIGSLIGKWISVGQQATLTLMSAFDPNGSADTTVQSVQNELEVIPVSSPSDAVMHTIHLPLVAR